jgi:prepilin-type N-terminal cleavage/methylation domain-containing protein
LSPISENVDAENQRHSDAGFTLIETIVGLLILAISTGLLVQSIASASAQIRTARNLIAAEQTALSVLALRSSQSVLQEINQGIDPVSKLFWRYRVKRIVRNDGDIRLTDVDLIDIEVRLASDAPTILRFKTLFQSKKPS